LAAPVILPGRRDWRPRATSIQLLQCEPRLVRIVSSLVAADRIPASSYITPTGHSQQSVPTSHNRHNIVYCSRNTNCNHPRPVVFQIASRPKAPPSSLRRGTEHSQTSINCHRSPIDKRYGNDDIVVNNQSSRSLPRLCVCDLYAPIHLYINSRHMQWGSVYVSSRPKPWVSPGRHRRFHVSFISLRISVGAHFRRPSSSDINILYGREDEAGRQRRAQLQGG